MIAKLEHLILVHRAQFLDYGGRLVVPVRLVEIEKLRGSSEREEENARGDKQPDIRVPLSESHHWTIMIAKLPTYK
jgi:hypothetical protein